MIIALTGTPGTGKTTIASALREKGYDVLDITAYIKENDLLEEYDEKRDTHDVDVDKLKEHLGLQSNCENTIIIEGHLSHLLSPDITIVLRCSPSVLKDRLEKRGYSDSKVKENVQSEVMDVILCESADLGNEVFEIDCTDKGTNIIISNIEDILSGNTDMFMPGSIDWTKEMEKWF